MGLFFNSDISKLYLGNTEVKEVYLGSQKVWPVGLPVGTTFNFDYTGAVQSVELPAGKYKLQCWGAQGGTSYGSSSGAGSKGGYSEGILTLTEKTTLYVFVGGQGSRGSSSSLVNGGWNGGGASVGYASYNSGGTNGYSYPACGGGATDISTVTSSMSYSSGRTNRSSASLLARCIVAGGGAGGSYRHTTTTTTTSTNKSSNISVSGRADIEHSNGNFFYMGSISGVSGHTYSFKSTSSNVVIKHFDIYINGSYSTTSSSYTVSRSGVTVRPVLQAKTAGVTVSGTVVDSWTESTTNTSTSSGYSNKSQQGGGTSGKGQYPGTQTSAGNGGAFGLGANQSVNNYRYCGGGGGGGWYGGGTKYSDSSTSYVNYSGGGSGFVNTSANASYRPSGYTGLQLDSGTTTAGNTSHPSTSGGTETGHSGNGYARITVIE